MVCVARGCSVLRTRSSNAASSSALPYYLVSASARQVQHRVRKRQARARAARCVWRARREGRVAFGRGRRGVVSARLFARGA
eukprot:11180990-Lingulodinium_polyedra.AAC.1